MKYIKPVFVLSILVSCFLLLAFYIAIILRYEFMRADVLDYASMGWNIVFHEHPPLYALTVAFARLLTLNAVPPIILMMGINLVALGACVFVIMDISNSAGVRPGWAALTALLFGLWPFVGLTYAAIPMADIPAIALTLFGMALLRKLKYTQAGWIFGLAMITHKGVWLVIGLVILADFYMRREFFSKRNVFFLVGVLLPVTVLWLVGAFYYHSADWIMAKSLLANASMDGKFPFLNGLLGTFSEGGWKGLIKGSIVLFWFVLSIITLFSSLKLKFQYYEICAAISLAVLIMFFFSSALTIWGPVRFSRFLVLPLMFSFHSYLGEKQFSRRAMIAVAILLLGCLLTQFAYSWYTVAVYYG